jgi:hypothetical protein
MSSDLGKLSLIQRHPIDVEHERVMTVAVGEPVPSELLLDLRP